MTEQTPHSSPSRVTWRRWLWIALALATLGFVTIIVFETEDIADVSTRQDAAPLPVVTVVQRSPAVATAQISALAELRPRWDIDLRTPVAGRITAVHDSALTGARVKRGAALYSIEKSAYATAVASAKLAVAEAELAVRQAENRTEVARRQFKRDGQKPPTDLALHLPELRIAQTALNAARSQLLSAQQQLNDTEIRAPFDGVVTHRAASLGETVGQGDTLLHLSDRKQFELSVALSPAQWALLQHPVAGSKAILHHRDGQRLGQALVRDGGGFLASPTRQIQVFLDVTDPDPKMLAGDVVRVHFKGQELHDTLTLPESALTRDGYIWLVKENHLHRMQPEILFRARNSFTIALPAEQADVALWQIVRTPLASFLPGQPIAARLAEE